MARHREEEIVQLLDSLRSLLDGKGPLAVAYDPEKVTATGALAVRASIVSQGAHSTLGSLSSPTRRRVLRRLGEGPCTFTAAMQAAKLDDTSNIAFHLRKLSESGLIEHAPDKRYRLTERGKGAIQILDDVNRLDSKLRSRNTVLSWGPLVSDSVP
ncbi:MAG: winged helix-turn-helix domain-containing protein [Thermoplasmata archaeon]